MNKKYLYILFFPLLFIDGLYAKDIHLSSDKITPTWIKSFADLKKYNQSYEYKVVINEGPDLNRLQNDKLVNLGSYLKSTNNINGTIDKIVESNISNNNTEYKSSHKLSFRTQTSIETFECELIDDYWEQIYIPGIGLRFRYYTLYAVSVPEWNPTYFDNFSLTTKYGGHGVWRSAIVPGWGQLYKGSKLKGGLIMGGTVATIGGIIVTDCVRSDYVRKISKTKSVEIKRAYATKADHYAMGRNVCIGALAALYIYNIIDAAVAPGARRVVVKDRKDRRYSFLPSTTDDGGPALSAFMRF